MTTEIQIKRCKVLIEELKTLRANTAKPKFNMGQWMEDALTKFTTKIGLHKAIMEATKNPCGTAACLAGKAGLIPKIRRLGFKWDVYADEDRPFDIFGRSHAGFHFDGYTGDLAVKNFFGHHTFHDVFMDIGGVRTLLQGIKALEGAVKEAEQAIADEAEFDNA